MYLQIDVAKKNLLNYKKLITIDIDSLYINYNIELMRNIFRLNNLHNKIYLKKTSKFNIFIVADMWKLNQFDIDINVNTKYIDTTLHIHFIYDDKENKYISAYSFLNINIMEDDLLYYKFKEIEINDIKNYNRIMYLNTQIIKYINNNFTILLVNYILNK